IKPKPISPDVYAALQRRRWPGNVRELKNAIERAVILSGDDITIADLPEDPHIDPFEEPAPADPRRSPAAPGAPPGKRRTLREFREQAERRHIIDTLVEHEWNVSRTAVALGVERTNLHKKIRAYGIQRGESG
ncbi:MAG: sigma-54-dependent Fis family transcriptional regulator, partial [Deltaproteobacteria bacterium]|nr:sigma-54-dependent Fis family transcriptional regulator [Deltaproteobacteria bacterium]